MKRFFTGLIIVSMTVFFGCGGSSNSSTPATYKITGAVKAGGNGIAGVTVGTVSTSAITDANGNYELSPLTSGSYTVTPALTGYTFTPATLTVSVNGADSTGNNFTGSIPVVQRKITGTVKVGGNAIAGVTVGTGSASAITDANGNYTLSSISNGSYTVTPLLAGCVFTPATLFVTVNGADSTGNNFSGTIPVIQRNSIGNIVGIQKDSANNSVTGVTAAIVVNGIIYTATSDANGVYDLILPANITQYLPDTFSYSVSKTGYIPITYVGNINTAIFQSSTPLALGDNTYVVLEIPPLTHHLGDSNYSGAANSQFQYPRAEGLTWTKSFNLTTQPSQFQSATISFKAKGIQYPDTVTVNSTVFKLANSDSAGGYSDYSITAPLNAFKANQSNTIAISSVMDSSGDYDDFEFLNVVINFATVPTSSGFTIAMLSGKTFTWVESNIIYKGINSGNTTATGAVTYNANGTMSVVASDGTRSSGTWTVNALGQLIGNYTAPVFETDTLILTNPNISSPLIATDTFTQPDGTTGSMTMTLTPN